MIKLLVVDDSALVRKLLGQVFAGEADFEIRFARNGLEALDQLKIFGPDVITLDVHMPQMDGLACLDRIMLERPCPVVMVSSLTAAGAEATLEAFRLGAVDFVPKPEGAVSLRIGELAPELVAKVRSAAKAKLRPSLRLTERVRHQIGGAAPIHRVTERASSADAAPRPATGDGLVLVGTSTGGPPALEALLTPLPMDFPWPILVAQHMPASFTGPLARRLDGLCALTVTEVTRPILLQPGCVYIGRGDADLIVSRRAAGLVAMAVPVQPGYPWHPSTDRLVRSAMGHLSSGQLIGVLMTGMGNDGAEAMALLHAEGGRTIAEAEETAVVWGMPGELVKVKGADWVLPLPRIADQLRRLTP
ncbi:chemotaxis-specific protein-glutamate methyltransferase CheB [Belnapia rosea]|uniref:chemotaxis-specific protein-glutamate methyltransferase CheB n=1 Tax=Belnapia rosea TaxID=938405 RepID=UPI000889CA21|nr:chemotaxis-specific protein-glutamate methyltransferase CheB [Belnapia rosea]SDB73099.1 two-component system, chemotaxis family, response regulator CheB [Belnapia rosea]